MRSIIGFCYFAAALVAQTLGTAGTVQAQPAITLTGPATVKPGQTGVVLSVNLSNSAGANVAAIQATIGLPAGFTVTSSSIGAAGTAATKTLYCATTAELCVLAAGVSGTALTGAQTTFSDGVLWTITGNVASTASGSLAFTISNQVAASSAAKAVGVTVTAGAALTLPVQSPCDINGDGKVDISDIQAYLNAQVFTVPSTLIDLNGDGVANIIDVQRIATAATPGGSCITGP